MVDETNAPVLADDERRQRRNRHPAHATRDLTAEVLTKVEQLARANEDAKHATGCHYKKPRNGSARLAAQDLPAADQTSTPSAPAVQNVPSAAISIARLT